MRIVILGGPRCGKTTLAGKLRVGWDAEGEALTAPLHVMHTDDLMHLDWSLASEQASSWFYTGGSWIIEGTMAVRALRKWLKKHPFPSTQKPCDVIYVLQRPYEDLTPGQTSMGKGVMTIFSEIVGDLTRRGVVIRKQQLEITPDQFRRYARS